MVGMVANVIIVDSRASRDRNADSGLTLPDIYMFLTQIQQSAQAPEICSGGFDFPSEKCVRSDPTIFLGNIWLNSLRYNFASTCDLI